MTAEQVHLEADGLRSAVATWRENVPGAIAYPELPAASGVDDAATAAVLLATRTRDHGHPPAVDGHTARRGVCRDNGHFERSG